MDLLSSGVSGGIQLLAFPPKALSRRKIEIELTREMVMQREEPTWHRAQHLETASLGTLLPLPAGPHMLWQ
jgi:hypothetical protein